MTVKMSKTEAQRGQVTSLVTQLVKLSSIPGQPDPTVELTLKPGIRELGGHTVVLQSVCAKLKGALGLPGDLPHPQLY